MTKNQKNIILVVGLVSPTVWSDFIRFKKKHGKKYQLAMLYDKGKLTPVAREKMNSIFDIELEANLDSEKSIYEAVMPYRDQIIAFTCRYEGAIPHLKKVIPLLPYIPSPSVDSLDWATHKLQMRRMLRRYNKKISPAYTIVSDTSKKALKKIEDKINFPLVIKPSGLAQSLLVTICYHPEELEKSLKTVFKRIKRIYKESNRSTTPEVLVEEYMEGDMYSIDAHVNASGKIYFYPVVSIKTGRTIGFDDFFGYHQTTMTNLTKSSITAIENVAQEAIHALRLRSTTVHVELMRTEQGWKVIELGPRLGGFRDLLYRLSYGIDATTNDIDIHIGIPPRIPKKRVGYASAFKFFAKKEGILTNLTGVKKAQDLESFHAINVNKKIGDKATFAKNGGISIFNIFLFNKSRPKLLADIRRLEQMVKIETKTKKS